MAQSIIRQFRNHLPLHNHDINISNIIAFSVTMLRFALREFSQGTYHAAEFVVEDEEAAYDTVLGHIRDLEDLDLVLFNLMIQHVFRLL
jgi:hypothetical protein